MMIASGQYSPAAAFGQKQTSAKSFVALTRDDMNASTGRFSLCAAIVLRSRTHHSIEDDVYQNVVNYAGSNLHEQNLAVHDDSLIALGRWRKRVS